MSVNQHRYVIVGIDLLSEEFKKLCPDLIERLLTDRSEYDESDFDDVYEKSLNANFHVISDLYSGKFLRVGKVLSFEPDESSWRRDMGIGGDVHITAEDLMIYTNDFVYQVFDMYPFDTPYGKFFRNFEERFPRDYNQLIKYFTRLQAFTYYT